MTHTQQLQKRIVELSSLIEAEKTGDNCQTFIDDCQLSIEAVQVQLKKSIKNPSGVEMVG